MVVAIALFFSGCGEQTTPAATELMSGPYTTPDFSRIVIGYPEAQRFHMLTSDGQDQYYMVQEPESTASKTPILLYMDGADGDETQGMDPDYAKGTFSRLRTLLAKRNWIYVTARLDDFAGLHRELETKYGPRPIILSGSSLGGNQSLREAMSNPEAYAGVIVMCPALPIGDAKPASRLVMPVYIETGERDVLIAEVSRKVAWVLKRQGTPYVYREIPNGTHRTPIEQIDWERALNFVEGRRLSAYNPSRRRGQRWTSTLCELRCAPTCADRSQLDSALPASYRVPVSWTRAGGNA